MTARPALARFAREMVPDGVMARRLLLLTLVQSIGNSVFITTSVIYLTGTLGFSAWLVGAGLSVAGGIGFLTAVPAGRISDRFGARRPLALTYLSLAAGFVGYVLLDNVALFLLVACLIGASESANSTFRSALVYRVAAAQGAVKLRAQMRTVLNAGFAVGAAGSTLVLASHSRALFLIAFGVNALVHVLCAVTARSVRVESDGPAAGSPARPGWTAVRDLRFLSLSLLNGFLEIHYSVLVVALPLWIVQHTSAPVGLQSVIIAANTILAILFQVTASRGAETVSGAVRLVRISGVSLFVACGVFSLSADAPPILAVIALLAGAALLTLGELTQSAGGWGLAFLLPPAAAIGEYQGVFAFGRAVQQFAGPLLVVSTAVHLGRPGWVLLGGLFLLASLVIPLLAGGEPGPPASTSPRETHTGNGVTSDR